MSDNPGLDQIITGQVTSMLEDFQGLPSDFLTGIQQWLQDNPPSLQNSDLQGGTLTPADGSPHGIAWGSGTVHFTASQTSGVDSQPHGLGAAPVFFIAFPTVTPCVLGGTADGVNINTTGWIPTAATTTIGYFWLAIL